MVKFTANTDFDFDVSSVTIIRDSATLTKRASAKELLQFEKTPGQTDLHIIALGAYEGTGFNRNGDAFLEEDCIKNHHFFKKADRAVHRHHKNKPSDPKYGNIKASAYNAPMKRIELVVGLDNDKCADILDEQEKKGYTSWSMASKQAYDICTWCNHKAKTDKDRCKCIPDKIGELNDEGVMCGMLNPEPKWFEISHVGRGADRIGMSLKLASDQRIKPMLPSDFLQLYPGFQPPDDELLISKKAGEKREILKKLAQMEKHVEGLSNGKPGKNTAKDLFLRRQRRLKKSPEISDGDMDELRKHEPSKTMRCMASKGLLLSPDEFVKYLFGRRAPASVGEGMKTHLPGAFSRLEDQGCGEAVNCEKFDPSPSDMMPKELKALVSRLFDGHSMFGEPSVRRVMRITVEMGPKGDEPQETKAPPTKNKADEKLAEVYSSYKLAALQYMQENGTLTDEVLWNAVIQNT